MKQKNKWLFIISFFLSTVTQGQLAKGTWLVGGSGKFNSYSEFNSSSTLSNNAKNTQMDISTSIGYFVFDKIAFGLRPTFSSIRAKGTTPGELSQNLQRYWIGPFGRYYFLNNEKQYNIVTDLSYQTGFFGGFAKGNLTTFSALAGPVIYFNSSVGFEFLFGYNYSKEDIEESYKDLRKGFQISVGFQIHLEK